MKVKRIISMLLVGVMAFGLLAGCGSKEENDTQQEAQTNSGDASSKEAGASDVTAASAGEGGNTLVVYYSATGNTKAVANTIAGATGGDLFELEPTEPYTDADLDWTDDSSRVSVEHENEAERDVELVADTVENFADYDTIFIGYPKMEYAI